MRKAFVFVTLSTLLALILWFAGRPPAGVVAGMVPPSAPEWLLAPPGKHVSTGATGTENPVLSVSPGGEIMIVYDNWITGDEDKDPYYTISTNEGTTWTAPQPIEASPGIDSFNVTVDHGADGRAHAVWAEKEANGLSLLYAQRAGGAWSATPFTLSSLPSSTDVIAEPDIAVTGSNDVDVVWSEGNPGGGGGGNPNIWYIRSVNGGQTWGTKARVAIRGGSSRLPSLAVSTDGKRHVVWAQGVPGGQGHTVILYSQGSVSGTSITWTPAITLSQAISVTQYTSTQPRIVANGNHLHVSFTRSETVGVADRIQWGVYMNCRVNCATMANWSEYVVATGEQTPVEVTEQTPFDLKSSIVFAVRCPYIFFHGATENTFDRELLWDVNGCDSWSLSGWDQVTEESARSVNPSAEVAGNVVHVAYQRVLPEQTQGGQVYWMYGQIPLDLYLPITMKP